jgi:hypothetical protein
MSTETDYSWSGSAWVESWRDTYTYGSNGKLALRVYQIWSGGAWVDEDRTTFIWDANGRPTQFLYEEYTGGAWVNSDRCDITTVELASGYHEYKSPTGEIQPLNWERFIIFGEEINRYLGQ